MDFISPDLFCCVNNNGHIWQVELWKQSLPPNMESFLQLPANEFPVPSANSSQLDFAAARLQLCHDKSLAGHDEDPGKYRLILAAGNILRFYQASTEKILKTFEDDIVVAENMSEITYLLSIPGSTLLLITATNYEETFLFVLDLSKKSEHVVCKHKLIDPVKKLQYVIGADGMYNVLVLTEYGKLYDFVLRQRHDSYSVMERLFHPVYKAFQCSSVNANIQLAATGNDVFCDTIVDFTLSYGGSEIIIQPESGDCFGFNIVKNEMVTSLVFDSSVNGFGYLGIAKEFLFHIGGSGAIEQNILRTFDIKKLVALPATSIEIPPAVPGEEASQIESNAESSFFGLRSSFGNCILIEAKSGDWFPLNPAKLKSFKPTSSTVKQSHDQQNTQKEGISDPFSLDSSISTADLNLNDPIVKEWIEKINSLNKRNQALPEEHRLKFEQMMVNSTYQAKLEAEVNEKLHNIELEQEKKVEDTFNEIKGFRQKFYDNLDAPASRLVSVDDESLFVENFSMKNRKLSRKLFDQVVVKRKVENELVRDDNTAKAQQEIQRQKAAEEESWKSKQDGKEKASEESLKLVLTKIDHAKSLAFPTKTHEYLLDVQNLQTKWKKLEQIIVLDELVSEAKEHFNSLFNETITARNNEIQRFVDRNNKIANICKELDSDTKPWITNVVPDCSADTLFKAIDNLNIEDKSNSNKQKNNGSSFQKNQEFVDAVHEWMGDSYDDKAAKTISPPACLAKPEADLTPDEIQIITQYKARVIEMENERQRRTAYLHEELKRLSGENRESSSKFAKKIAELKSKKIEYEIVICKMTIEKNLLAQNVNTVRLLEYQDLNLNSRLQVIKREEEELTTDVPKIKSDLERHRQEYDAITRTGNRLDKIFKMKTYNGSKTLHELFDKIRVGSLEYLSSLRPEQLTKPDSISVSEWKDFHDFLNHLLPWAMQKEEAKAAYAKVQELANLTLKLAEDMKDEAESYIHACSKLKNQIRNRGNDIPMLLPVPYKRHEAGDISTLSDYGSCQLITKPGVEVLNEKLRQLTVKCGRNIKECLKQQHLLLQKTWEHRLIEFQVDERMMILKEMHAFKIDDQILDFLKGEDNAGEKGDNHEDNALEVRLGQLSKNHEKKLSIQKRHLRDLVRELTARRNENKTLEQEINTFTQETGRLEDKLSTFNDFIQWDTQKKSDLQYSFALRAQLREAESQLSELKEKLAAEKTKSFPRFAT